MKAAAKIAPLHPVHSSATGKQKRLNEPVSFECMPSQRRGKRRGNADDADDAKSVSDISRAPDPGKSGLAACHNGAAPMEDMKQHSQ